MTSSEQAQAGPDQGQDLAERRVGLDEAQFNNRAFRDMTILMGAGMGMGLLSVAGAVTGRAHPYFAAASIMVLGYLAAFLCGGALGFIFSVPRVARIDEAQPGAAGGRRNGRLLQSNTNLERISDWLTTMIVGASLTQLNNAPRLFDALSGVFAQCTLFPPPHEAGLLPIAGPLNVLFGAVSGFLFTYLYTRLVLIGLFVKAERNS